MCCFRMIKEMDELYHVKSKTESGPQTRSLLHPSEMLTDSQQTTYSRTKDVSLCAKLARMVEIDGWNKILFVTASCQTTQEAEGQTKRDFQSPLPSN